MSNLYFVFSIIAGICYVLFCVLVFIELRHISGRLRLLIEMVKIPTTESKSFGDFLREAGSGDWVPTKPGEVQASIIDDGKGNRTVELKK